MSDTRVERVSDRELQVTRSFRATPERVFAVYTEPRHVERWWAPKSRGARVVSIEATVKPGGTYRYTWATREGHVFAFVGTYLEVAPPGRLVYTQVFEPKADLGEGVITASFEAYGDGTLFVSRELYPSKVALDFAIGTGMEKGMRETLEQLDALVAELDA